LVDGLQSIHICADKDHGDGSQWSGINVPASGYPLYNLKGEFRSALEFKQRFISGTCSRYQIAYSQHCGGRSQVASILCCTTFEELVEWFETEYQTHIAAQMRSGTNRIFKPLANSAPEMLNEDEDDNRETLHSAHGQRKVRKLYDVESKIHESKADDVLSALALQSKLMAQVLEKFTSPPPIQHATQDHSQHRLFGLSQESSKRRSFRPPSNAAQKVCWICKGTHYAPQCPLISRLELLILLKNRVFRTNRNNPNANSHVTVDSLLAMENLSPMTSEEAGLLDKIYKPLEAKERKSTKGLNPTAYCHYCHAVGHWTRDCVEFCPYCLKVGHGWKLCTDPAHTKVISDRKSSMGELHSVDVVFTLCNAHDEDTNYCSDN
jgi:hypothetical protein